jgi:thymidylate kinase
VEINIIHPVVALEGLPYSGKTTLAAALTKEAQSRGISVLVFSEFSESPSGHIIEDCVRDNSYRQWPLSTQTFLFLADKCVTSSFAAEVLSDVALSPHTRVIFDRSIFSVVAFQAAIKYPQLPDRFQLSSFLEACQTLAGGELIIPKKVIYLDVAPSVCYERGLPAEAFSLEELSRIRETYYKLAQDYQFKIINDMDIPEKILQESISFLEDSHWL